MLSVVVASLAAFVAGVTGTWSPCGLSMIETFSHPRSGRGGTTLGASLAALLAGCVAGGVATFGVLGLVGGFTGGGTTLVLAALAVCLAAGWAEWRSVRIVPQVRNQVPERWRRVLPLPVVGMLYGVLLGLGFTTFILTFAMWALVVSCLALASGAAGVAVGVAFGVGRALPIVVLTPMTRQGASAQHILETRPQLLAGARRLNGAALLALSAAWLGVLTPIGAAAPRSTVAVRHAFDPVADGAFVMWRGLDGQVYTNRTDQPVVAGATQAAAGGGLVAIARGSSVEVGGQALAVPGDPPSALAVSDRWLAWRQGSPGGRERIIARNLSDGREVFVAEARIGWLSRPALSGDLIAYSQASRRTSRVIVRNLANGAAARVGARWGQLRDPALSATALIYVHQTECSQTLVRRPIDGRGRARGLWRLAAPVARDAGHEHDRTDQGAEASGCARGTRRGRTVMGSTALVRGTAFVTLHRVGRPGQPWIARVRA